MSQLLATLKLDVRLQIRNKLYHIGLAVAVLFGLAGRFFFNPEHAPEVLTIFCLTATSVSTYFFAAALVLLEKSQGTLEALRTSPLTSSTYLLSKTITLTCFATVETAVVYAVAFLVAPLSPWPMLFGIILLGALQTLVGLGQVASHNAVTSFLIPGAVLISTLGQLPAFFVLGIGPPALWYLVPTQGCVLMIMGSFKPLETWQWLYAVLVSLGSLVLAAWWARRRFSKFVALQEA